MKKINHRRATFAAHRKRFVVTVLLFVLGLAAKPALAEFSIGLGLGSFDNIYVNEDDDSGGIPYIAYRGERLRIDFRGVGYRLLADQPLELIAQFDFRDDDIQNDQGQVIRSFDPTYYAGIGYGPVQDGFGPVLQAVTELSDEHEGYQLAGGISYATRLGSWNLQTMLTLVYEDSDMANYFYRSDPDSGFPDSAGDIDSITNVNLNATLVNPLTDNLTLLLLFNYLRLDSDIEDGDLVDADDATTVIGGISYSF